jgi:hypothetical protein
MKRVSTPSERLWARRAEWADTTTFAGRRGRDRAPVTLAVTAERIAGGTELRAATADFLDDLRWSGDADDALHRISAEPCHVDAHTDAYLAALAEHVAAAHGRPTPDWTRRPGRFLDHFWWPSRTTGLHARAGRITRGVPPPRHLHRPLDACSHLMNRQDIVAALTTLGARLAAAGVTADLYVVGGAAIALAYDERRSTRDLRGGGPGHLSMARDPARFHVVRRTPGAPVVVAVGRQLRRGLAATADRSVTVLYANTTR